MTDSSAAKLTGPWAQKDLFIRLAKEFGADRAVAAYDELKHAMGERLTATLTGTDHDAMRKRIHNDMRAHIISWTMEHYSTKSERARKGKTPTAAEATRVEDKITAELDPADWSVPVVPSPQGFETGVALVERDQVRHWGEQPVRDLPMAVVALGDVLEGLPGRLLQVPIRATEEGGQITRKFMKGAIYQMCLTTPVACKSVPVSINREHLNAAAKMAVRVTVALHEAHASSDFKKFFDDQFKGGRVHKTRGAGKADGKLSHKPTVRSESERKAGEEVKVTFEALLKRMVPSISYHAPMSVVRRLSGQRAISVVVAVSSSLASSMLMPASGKHGVFFQYCYLGDAAGLLKEREQQEILWCPRGDTLQDALKRTEQVEGHLGIIHAAGPKGGFGIRMPREKAAAVRKQVTGKDGPEQALRWKVSGFLAPFVTAVQAKALLETLGWTVEAYSMFFDPKSRSHVAMVRSAGQPPARSIECDGTVLMVEEAEAKHKLAGDAAPRVVLKDLTAKATAARQPAPLLTVGPLPCPPAAGAQGQGGPGEQPWLRGIAEVGRKEVDSDGEARMRDAASAISSASPPVIPRTLQEERSRLQQLETRVQELLTRVEQGEETAKSTATQIQQAAIAMGEVRTAVAEVKEQQQKASTDVGLKFDAIMKMLSKKGDGDVQEPEAKVAKVE